MLVASGLIVGESLFGVLLAGVIVASGNGTPFAVVGDTFQTIAMWIGALAFVTVIYSLYRWSANLARGVTGAR